MPGAGYARNTLTACVKATFLSWYWCGILTCNIDLNPCCMQPLQRALNELVISGVPTTTVYHNMILEIEDFVNGNVDTGFIPSHQAELSEPPPPREVLHLIHTLCF